MFDEHTVNAPNSPSVRADRIGSRQLRPLRHAAPWRGPTGIIVALFVLCGFAGRAQASTYTQGEGSGSAWCSTYGGTNEANYDDVYACSPNSKTAGATPFDNAAGFQCVELADRFLWNVYEKKPISANGWNFARTVHVAYPSIGLVANGTIGQPYLPGDIVSFTGNAGTPVAGEGHVAVVTASTENAAGNGSVTVIQQNATGYVQTLNVENWGLRMPAGSWVTPYDFVSFPTTGSGPPVAQPPTGSPAVVLSDGSGPYPWVLSAFATAADGRLYATWQSAAGGAWNGWQPIGGNPPGGGAEGKPAVYLNP